DAKSADAVFGSVVELVPIDLTIDLHQFHNAAEHRIGRFRISVTTDDLGKDKKTVPLGLPESLQSIVRQPVAKRSQQQTAQLHKFLTLTNKRFIDSNKKLADAKKALPPDQQLVQLKQRQERLKRPTADPASLVRLREDVKYSSAQLDQLRLTMAEDLTWALINSPAFLFNH
ncbi:MAG: hypothetical protein AAFP90_09960, partial [Planctomycetota bacterium]